MISQISQIYSLSLKLTVVCFHTQFAISMNSAFNPLSAQVEQDMRLKAEERVKQLERQLAFLKQTFQKELKKRKLPLVSEPPRKKPKLSPPESPIRVKKEPSVQ